VVGVLRGTLGHQTLFSVCTCECLIGSSPLTQDDAHVEMGSFLHAVEDEMLCSSLMPDKVPYFNAPIYLQNKSVIGKVDEILGPINEVYFSVKMGEGMVASSFKKGDKVYIAGDKLLPIERFLPKPKVAGACLPSTVFQLQGHTLLKF
jgi:H/ACA ribonucleoprotein complex subunit 1